MDHSKSGGDKSRVTFSQVLGNRRFCMLWLARFASSVGRLAGNSADYRFFPWHSSLGTFIYELSH